jgi:hypothetical protein
MPASNSTVTVAFKTSNQIHINIYNWLHSQDESASELIREAVIAAYEFRSIEQADVPSDKKIRALLKSNAELHKLLELNEMIASITLSASPSALQPLAPAVEPVVAIGVRKLSESIKPDVNDDDDDEDYECIVDID